MKKIFLFLFFFALAAVQGWAGEIPFGWNVADSSGTVEDMLFMPDNKQFIIATQNAIEIRNSATGAFVHSYQKINSFYANIGFSPDSSKIIFTYDTTIEVRRADDLSVFASVNLNLGADTIDPHSNHLYLFLTKMVIDPIKPYAYILWDQTPLVVTSYWYERRKIIIFNYETMHQVGELTSNGEDTTGISLITISKDGKYLAGISGNSLSKTDTYLKVWSLDSLKSIQNILISKYIDPTTYGEADCIKFANNNTSNIYFSGGFPQSKTDYSHIGLFIYDLAQNKISDTTFVGNSIPVGEGKFVLTADTNRIIFYNSDYLSILNYASKSIENSLYIWKVDSLRLAGNIIYSNTYNYIIGSNGNKMTMLQYDSQTSVPENQKIIQTIYPNPTNNSIIINNICQTLPQYYRILDNYGHIINNTAITAISNAIPIDFSIYAHGIYFIQLSCNNHTETYKVIKE